MSELHYPTASATPSREKMGSLDEVFDRTQLTLDKKVPSLITQSNALNLRNDESVLVRSSCKAFNPSNFNPSSFH